MVQGPPTMRVILNSPRAVALSNLWELTSGLAESCSQVKLGGWEALGVISDPEGVGALCGRLWSSPG